MTDFKLAFSESFFRALKRKASFLHKFRFQDGRIYHTFHIGAGSPSSSFQFARVSRLKLAVSILGNIKGRFSTRKSENYLLY